MKLRRDGCKYDGIGSWSIIGKYRRLACWYANQKVLRVPRECEGTLVDATGGLFLDNWLGNGGVKHQNPSPDRNHYSIVVAGWSTEVMDIF